MPRTRPGFSTPHVESDGGLVWTSPCEPRIAMVSKGGNFLSRQNPGFPHAPWKAMGTRCGQVVVSIAPQAFRSVVKICPRCTIEAGSAEPALCSRPSQPCIGSALHQVRRFSTPNVESDGSLLWTSTGERHTASVSQRGVFLSITGNANAPHRAGRPGSIRCRWIRR